MYIPFWIVIWILAALLITMLFGALTYYAEKDKVFFLEGKLRHEIGYVIRGEQRRKKLLSRRIYSKDRRKKGM